MAFQLPVGEVFLALGSRVTFVALGPWRWTPHHSFAELFRMFITPQEPVFASMDPLDFLVAA